MDQRKNSKIIFFIILTAIALAVLAYILFFKPNPIIRVNLNKIRPAEKQKSALIIEAPSEVDGVGRKFSVAINVDTEGNYINAIQSYLEFDPKVLEIDSTNTEQSFCKFYPENNYSNEKGLIRLACGTPYPGFRGTGVVQNIEFIAKAIKTTELKFGKESMVLANDGKGTNLLKDASPVQIRVKPVL